MFEPGQKVMVTGSNFDKKTGPRVGSIGFVSDFTVNFHGLFFSRIVWYRFGNQEKFRMETSPYAMPFKSPTSNFPVRIRDFGVRRGGTLIPVFEKKKIEDMEGLEFNCWLYSIMRMYKGHRASGKIRNKMGFLPWDYSPKMFAARDFPVKERIAYANIARELKLIAFKSLQNDMNQHYNQALQWIDRFTRDGYSPDWIVRRTIRKRGIRYEYFYELFVRMAFVNIIGQAAINKMNTDNHPYNPILRLLWQEWKKLHEISG